MKRQLYIGVICGLLILLFTYTALSKLTDFNSFKETLRLSPLIGNQNDFLAWILPVAELIIASLLFIPRFRLTGMLSSLLLLLLLTLYLGCLLLFWPGDLPCSCGGVISRMTWKQHVLFNFVFITLNTIGIFLHTRSKNIVATNRM